MNLSPLLIKPPHLSFPSQGEGLFLMDRNGMESPPSDAGGDRGGR